MNKLDILVIVAHPDDAELGCGGTIASHIAQGKKVGVVDLTQGELGTRGTAETRKVEAANAARILGLSVRENLGFRDGFFANDEAHQKEVIRVIRKYCPEIVIANAIRDRHPDHGKGAELVRFACFLAGLEKIQTLENGEIQKAHRPKNLYHMIQSDYIEPDFVVDISDFWEQKKKAVLAFETQFFNPDQAEKSLSGSQTFISTPDFLYFLEGRAREHGQSIRCSYGEGFTKTKQIGIRDLMSLA